MILDEAQIIDVMPTLLAGWGLSLPAGMNGRVVREMLVAPPEVRWEEAEEEGVGGEDRDFEEMMARLRALGYLE